MTIKETIRRINPSGWIAILLALLLVELIAAGAVFAMHKLDMIHFTESDGSVAKLDTINILLLGTDDRDPDGGIGDFTPTLQKGARADACMLLSVDMKKHTARLVSLERAIGVDIDGVGLDWLTHSFAYGGAEETLKIVREQFGVDVRRYVRVNVGGAGRIIDSIGGVDIDLTQTEADALNGKIYSNATTKHTVKAGINHLDGFDAIAYARQRFIDSDFHRVQRQRNVLQAAINKTKTLSLRQLNSLLDTAVPMVETNFSKSEIAALMPKTVSFLGVRLEQMTLPLTGMYGKAYTADGRSMMMLDADEAHRVMTEFISGGFDTENYKPTAEVAERVAKAQAAALAQTPAPVDSARDSGEKRSEAATSQDMPPEPAETAQESENISGRVPASPEPQEALTPALPPESESISIPPELTEETEQQ